MLAVVRVDFKTLGRDNSNYLTLLSNSENPTSRCNTIFSLSNSDTYNEIMVHGNHVSIQKCIGYGDCINEFGTLVVQRKIVFFTNMFLILFLVQCTSKATDRRMRMDCTSAYNIPFCYNFVLHHLRAKKIIN